MSKINPYRMLGRIAQLPYSLMTRYNMRLTANVPDVRQLLFALSTKLPPADREVCLRAIEQYSKFLEQTMSMRLPQDEIGRLHSEGIDETKYLMNAYPSAYGIYIFNDEDYLAQARAKAAAAKARKSRITKIAVGALAAVVLGVVVYNLPYFKEMRAYGDVKAAYDNDNNNKLNSSVDYYTDNFPEGKHLDDVLMMYVDHRKKSIESPIALLYATEKYLSILPDGPHAAECHQIISDVWDDEIAKYQSNIEHPTKATDFVVDMLRYMKRENIREVAVVSHPELKLKDFADYSDGEQALMRYMYGNSEPPLSTLVSIKDKINDKDASNWAYYITKALNDGFEEVLTPYFIKFITVDDESEIESNMPRVNATFIVKTQEDSFGFPELWVYTETKQQNYQTISKNESLVLGLAMDFDVDFILPGTGKEYNFKSTGDPGSADIKGDPNTAYSTMCQRCTQAFAQNLAGWLGLPQEAE